VLSLLDDSSAGRFLAEPVDFTRDAVEDFLPVAITGVLTFSKTVKFSLLDSQSMYHTSNPNV